MRVSIVIPAYNEANSISAILTELKTLPEINEIIVVDDNSHDGTTEKVTAFPDVRLIRHPYNMGNGAAVKSGIRAATGDVILLLDGDGQHPPRVIPHLLSHLEQYDMVVGARNAASEAKWHRTLANRVFNTYASYIVGYPVPDLTSGFRAIRADVARQFLYLLPNGFSYPTTLTICLFRAGYAVKYEPFVSPARVGQSKVRPFRDGPRFLLTLTRLGTLFVPLKVFIPISVLLLTLGSIYTLLTLALESRFSGFGSLIISIGVLVFVLGLISEQIALLRYADTDR